MRRLRRPFLLALLLPLATLACSDDGGNDNPATLVAACSNPLPGTGSRVFLSCGTVSGGMISVDVFGAESGDVVDGYSLRINFAPTAFRYVGFALDQNLFGSACGQGAVLCADNLSSANSSGEIVLGIDLVNSLQTGVTIGTTPQLLARLMFEAAAPANTTLQFGAAAAPGCIGSSTSGNALTSFDSGCLTGSTVIAGVTFTGGLTLSAVAQ